MLRCCFVVLAVSALLGACGGATEASRPSGSSSSGGDGRACTELGCQNGFQVDFTYRERGAYVFDLEVDGAPVVCKATLPLPKGAFEACTTSAAQLGLVGAMLPESQQSIGGLLFVGSPNVVKVRAQRDGKVLAETTLRPTYTITPGPNGPGCEPKECKAAKAALP